ncbi:MAG: family efflux transporter permease subunit, partial [Devosia sp.]|uniref:MFS transporter n=1 Tax=Devosia sp. TaxID=1871048 RepID=UPI0026054BEB
DLRMFRDRNFAMGTVFIFIVSVTVFAALALLPPFLQSLMGYSVMDSGILIAPRGVAAMISMISAGMLMRWIDARVLVFAGLLISAYSQYMMWGFDLEMNSTPVVLSGLVGGVGLGLVFVPISALTFTTLNARFRTEATSFFALSRNFGQSMGIALVSAVLTNMVQVNQTVLGSHLTATSPEVAKQLPAILTGNQEWLAVAQLLVQQQAAMVSYLDDFVLMTWVTLAAIPIVFLLRGAKAAPAGSTGAHVALD